MSAYLGSVICGIPNFCWGRGGGGGLPAPQVFSRGRPIDFSVFERIVQGLGLGFRVQGSEIKVHGLGVWATVRRAQRHPSSSQFLCVCLGLLVADYSIPSVQELHSSPWVSV